MCLPDAALLGLLFARSAASTIATRTGRAFGSGTAFAIGGFGRLAHAAPARFGTADFFEREQMDLQSQHSIKILARIPRFTVPKIPCSMLCQL